MPHVAFGMLFSLLMIAYIVLFSAQLSRLTALAWGSTWVTSFIVRILNIHQSGVLTVLAWLVPHETAAVSAQVLCTPYNHAPCHFMQSHICNGVCVFSCNLPPALLAEWPGSFMCYCGNRGGTNTKMSQHRKSTLEKKILSQLQQGFKPTTFQSRVQHSNHWAIPTPILFFLSAFIICDQKWSKPVLWSGSCLQGQCDTCTCTTAQDNSTFAVQYLRIILIPGFALT